MAPFKRLTGIAAPLMEENVDTDIIFPARFLLITAREGLGRYAFHDRRTDPGFILNRPPFDAAAILVAGANFGCGSSRENAVWALLGAGIRCVVAPSFGEIFRANCLRNGLLPILLAPDMVGALAAAAAAGQTFTIDLPTATLQVAGGIALSFPIAEEQRQALLNGWDETALILNGFGADIAAFEARQRAVQPWLFATEPAA